MASLYCAYALVLYALRGAEPYERRGATLFLVLGAYLTSGVAGGLVWGALYPLRRSLPGQLLVGVAIATLAILNVQVARAGLPTAWSQADWEAVFALGPLFGIACTFALRRVWGVR